MVYRTGTGRLEVEVVEDHSGAPDSVTLTIWAGPETAPRKVVTLVFHHFFGGGWDCEVVQLDQSLIEGREDRFSLLFEIIEEIKPFCEALEGWERNENPDDLPNRQILQEFLRWRTRKIVLELNPVPTE